MSAQKVTVSYDPDNDTFACSMHSGGAVQATAAIGATVEDGSCRYELVTAAGAVGIDRAEKVANAAYFLMVALRGSRM